MQSDGKDVDQLELLHGWWDTLSKNLENWLVVSLKLTIFLSHNPSISLLDIFSREMNI